MDESHYQIYRTACQIRAFEDAIARAADQGQVPGLAHLCTGAEILEATICTTLLDNDFVTGSHRSHGLAIGCGADTYTTAAEIFGKAAGLSGGFGGTQHLVAAKSGFLTSNGIVGAQVPLAAGAALTAKTLKNGGIGIGVFGDGAANQGAVLETMNLAVALDLPLLFILENNGIGQSTSAEYASGGTSLSKRAKAFGLRVETLQSSEVERTLKLIPKLINDIRSTGKPVFLEAFVPRLSGHYYGEQQDFGKDTSDPLSILEHLLEIDNSSLDGEREQLESTIRAEVARAVTAIAPSPNALAQWETNWRASS